MVKGHVENAPNKNYIYLKLTDIKFGNDVVKMLKSKFGIDAKVDKTFGNIPTVSFASKKVVSEKMNQIKEASHSDTYFDTFTDAAEFARKTAEKKGFEIDTNDWHSQVTMGGRYNRARPSVGKTTTFTVNLLKNNKPTKKYLHFQVYGMQSGKFELNNYIGS